MRNGKETVERLFGTAKKPRITLYTDDRKSRMGKSGLRLLHESEKTGKDDSQEGKRELKVFIIDQVHTF